MPDAGGGGRGGPDEQQPTASVDALLGGLGRRGAVGLGVRRVGGYGRELRQQIPVDPPVGRAEQLEAIALSPGGAQPDEGGLVALVGLEPGLKVVPHLWRGLALETDQPGGGVRGSFFAGRHAPFLRRLNRSNNVACRSAIG
jgi:hypothetical protein